MRTWLRWKIGNVQVVAQDNLQESTSHKWFWLSLGRDPLVLLWARWIFIMVFRRRG